MFGLVLKKIHNKLYITNFYILFQIMHLYSVGKNMSGSGMENSIINMTEFSCQNKSILSSELVSDEKFWKITQGQKVGAIIAGVLILIFFLVGTLWNLFIIITFLIKHHLLKEPGNLLLFNVSISDLLICVTTMIFTYVTAFDQEFIFGSNDISRCVVCKTSGFFLVFLVLVSLHLLSALSIDRFILLWKPLRYRQIINRWKIGVVCFIIYIICFILAVLPLAGFGEIEFNPIFASCVPRFTPTANLYYVILIVVEVLIPITILAITNVWTFRIVSKFLTRNFHRHTIYQKQEAGGEKKKVVEVSKYQQQQSQLVKVFGALFIANIICYTPAIISVLVSAIVGIMDMEDTIPAEFFIFAFVSFLMNPVIHPIIESLFVKDLRYEVIRARKKIRRASTVIYRQTAGHFSNKALDEANKNFEQHEAKSTMNMQMTSSGLNTEQQKGEVMNDSTLTSSMEESELPQNGSTDPLSENNSAFTVVVNEERSQNITMVDPIPKTLKKEQKSVSFKETPTRIPLNTLQNCL